MLYATEIQCLCTVNYKFKCGLKTSVSLVLATEHLKTVSRVMKSLLYGHPSNTDTLLCPFRVRIREIQLYWLSTSPPGRGGGHVTEADIILKTEKALGSGDPRNEPRSCDCDMSRTVDNCDGQSFAGS